jgi:hypothetical protein
LVRRAIIVARDDHPAMFVVAGLVIAALVVAALVIVARLVVVAALVLVARFVMVVAAFAVAAVVAAAAAVAALAMAAAMLAAAMLAAVVVTAAFTALAAVGVSPGRGERAVEAYRQGGREAEGQGGHGGGLQQAAHAARLKVAVIRRRLPAQNGIHRLSS